MLSKHEDEIEKLRAMKELTATQVEIKAVIKIEENYGVVSHIYKVLSVKDNCSEDRLEKYLQL